MTVSDPSIPIGAVVKATGVSEATLRAWESRFGFPEPEREPSGHRRYSEAEVEQIRAVARHREEGLPLRLAIERARATSAPQSASIFARLRRSRLDLAPQPIRSRHLVGLSKAIEDEAAARAEDGLLIGSFQHESAYRESEDRWRDLGTRMTSFVLADFRRLATKTEAPSEVPVERSEPIAAEWSVVCLARGHSACLVGRERPGQERADEDRVFEAFFSLEPEVVRDVAQAAVQIVDNRAPAVAAAAQEVIDVAIDADPGAQLRLSGLITSRFLAQLG